MRIRYVGGAQEVTIRDIVDPSWNTWRAGQERDVPVGATIAVIAKGPDVEEGATEEVSLVDALLACGPNFVDASTGKNPLHVCTHCSGPVTSQGFRPSPEQGFIAYADADSKPLCVACYIVAYPEHERHHVSDLGISRNLRKQIDERRAASAPVASAAYFNASNTSATTAVAHVEE